MVDKARAAGFTNVRELKVWESAQIGALTVTACPGSHGVDEVTFMLQAHGSTVYFGGDSRLIPEMEEIPKRLAGMLRAEAVVPMHYRFQGSWFTETFILSYDGTPERFAEAE